MSDGVVRSFVVLGAGNVLAPMFSMALVLAISRLQGMELLGKYSLLMTVFVVGQSCAAFGLPVVVTREVARMRASAGRYFVNATVLTVALSALALTAMLPVAWRLAEPDVRVALVLTLLTVLPSAALANAEAVFIAYGLATDWVGLALAQTLARAAVGTVLVLLGFGIVALAVSMLALHVLGVGVLVWLFRRRGISVAGAVDPSLCRTLLREIPVVGAIPVVNQLYARSDILLLTWLGTWRDVGLYGAGLRLVDLARTVPAAYGKAIYPALARAHGRPQEFRSVARRGLRQVLLLVAPLAFVLGAFAYFLVPIIYGPDAAGGGTSLAVLAWSLLPLAVACVLAQVLFALGRQQVDLRVNVLATIVSVGANALLVPRLGAAGAATAMLGTTLLYAMLQHGWVKRHALDPRVVGYALRVAAVTAVGVASALSVHELGVAATVVIAGGVWILGVVAGRVVTREELGALRERFAARGRWLWGTR